MGPVRAEQKKGGSLAIRLESQKMLLPSLGALIKATRRASAQGVASRHGLGTCQPLLEPEE